MPDSAALPNPTDPILGIPGAHVIDFWRFAVGDARTNNVRGHLAEYLVARAAGANGFRIEWDEVDVVTPSGIRIEVKATGFVQAWEPTGAPRSGGTWRVNPPKRSGLRADVYVFALQTERDPQSYNPFDVSQWCFWVLTRREVTSASRKQFSEAYLSSVHAPTTWHGLADAITAAHNSEGTVTAP